MKEFSFHAFLIGFIITSACSTGNTGRVLESQVGEMTYSEALQIFGQPTDCKDAGSKTCCTWVYRPCQGKFYLRGGTMRKTYKEGPPVATLTFKKEVLADWELTGNWK